MVVVVVVASTCGTRPSVTQAQYCEQLPVALCDFYRRCGIADPEASCAAILTFNDPLNEPVNCKNDGRPFEPEGAARCLAVFREQSCGTSVAFCNPSFASVEGAACGTGCGPGLTCSAPCGKGTCVSRCDSRTGAGCAPHGVGESCSRQGNPACMAGLRCVADRCERVAPAPEMTCLVDGDCAVGAKCEVVDGGERRCSFGRKLGEACLPSGCLRGLECFSFTCRRIADVGGACASSGCPNNTFCKDVCTPLGSAGMACPCLPGFSCVDSICSLQVLSEGAPCSFDPGAAACDTGLQCAFAGDAGLRTCVRTESSMTPSMCP